MVMYVNEFETKENKIWTKDKIEPKHIHLMSDPEGNSFGFPRTSRGKHQDSRETKLTGFPRNLT